MASVTKCDRCKREFNAKEVFGLTADSKHSQRESYNRLRLIRKVRWFGWRSFIDSLDYVASWFSGKIEIDICGNCQDSFDNWLADPNYEQSIINRVIESPEEFEHLKQ